MVPSHFKYADQDPVVKKPTQFPREVFYAFVFLLKRSVPRQTALVSNWPRNCIWGERDDFMVYMDRLFISGNFFAYGKAIVSIADPVWRLANALKEFQGQG